MDTTCEVLAGLPFSVLRGTRVTDHGRSGVTLELDARPDWLQQHGYLHGVRLSPLVNNAITVVAGRTPSSDVAAGQR